MVLAGGGEQEDIQTMASSRRRSVAAAEDGETGDTCRICRGEATLDQPLFYPCKCSGSIRYVHQECLMEWLTHSQKKYCELCKTSFRFTKLYDQSMPDVLPLPLFIRQIALHGAKSVGHWLRYFIVVLVWTCLLPWCIRQIWRGLFWLADGSWMSEQDVQQLIGNESLLTLASGATNNSLQATNTTTNARHASGSVSNLWSILFGLSSGDALLRGLLRLIASKSFPATAALTNMNGTAGNMTASLLHAAERRPSLLSDVQSLYSFTKFSVVNNTLIDVLEGQLVCLSVIAAFILVFLIREWVINQQPIHLMPDPDQAPELPANQVQADDEGRQAARRRRRNVHLLPGQEDRPDAQILDIAQRPRAIPRPRRVAAEDRSEPGPRPSSPSRQDTEMMPEPVTAASGLSDSDDFIGDTVIRPIQEPAWSPFDIESPPLQRGIFDDAADIRRTIDERRRNESTPNPLVEAATPADALPESSTPTGLQHTAPAFDFGAFTARNNSRDFFFRAENNVGNNTDLSGESDEQDGPIALDSSHDASAESVDSLTEEAVIVDTIDADQSLNDAVTTEAVDLTNDILSESVGQNAVDTRTESLDVEQPLENPAPTTLKESLVEWLWPAEPDIPLPDAVLGTDRAPTTEQDGQAEGGLFAGAPLPPPAPAPAPAHEPNIQFGVDINDPNAMDDAEDLEGILELIGMEGPIAGMVQNVIFSVFLITLTLSASVWCPYIWGKIALLIMSNPIGIFLKAPLYFVSKTADILVDIMLLISGLLGFVLTNFVRTIKILIMLVLPSIGKHIKVGIVEDLAVSVTQTSSLRLEKALSITVFHLRPDLPTFSMQSHHALRVFKTAWSDIASAIIGDFVHSINNIEALWQSNGWWDLPLAIVKELTSLPGEVLSILSKSANWATAISESLRTPVFANPAEVDMSLIEWSTKDKILATMIGYTFFALAGVAYLRLAHFILGLKNDEEVHGVFADSLRQAGGVMKVIVIIGIEMIVFPLYCGCLLDVALLPLFQDASLQSRLAFIARAPLTGVFIHWFIGTCYMFHFALFVSMCRKILRRGVLYFIRDPDDPTFHPVRDVLERPIATQLSKIAFSACVYGGLVVVCLGGVVWTVSHISGIFPIQWATSEPRLAFPMDLIFFNFVLPFVLRKTEPSKKVASMYEWWFRKCARVLRLSHFLFNEEQEEEMKPSRWSKTVEQTTAKENELGDDEKHPKSTTETKPFEGLWVRAPAADSVRIPKDTQTFLEVTENNERVDGLADREKGLHGKSDERFAKIYIPPHFRFRIAAFVFLVWLFAASSGAAAGIVPLLLGRFVIKFVADSDLAPNDLYAYTIGVHLCGVVGAITFFAIGHQNMLRQRGTGIVSILMDASSRLANTARHVLGLLYLGAVFGVVLPLALSMVAELYVHMPLYTFLMNTRVFQRPSLASNTMVSGSAYIPTIYLVQSWTLGVLYLRLLVRMSTTYPDSRSRSARAVRSIIRNGVLYPDVRLASRAFVLPVVALSATLLALPPLLARLWIAAASVQDDVTRMWMYRTSYPILLATMSSVYSAYVLQRKIEGWQTKVRDEVYLVGERLHNFSDPAVKAKKVTPKPNDKGKVVDTVHGQAELQNHDESLAQTQSGNSRPNRPDNEEEDDTSGSDARIGLSSNINGNAQSTPHGLSEPASSSSAV